MIKKLLFAVFSFLFVLMPVSAKSFIYNENTLQVQEIKEPATEKPTNTLRNKFDIVQSDIITDYVQKLGKTGFYVSSELNSEEFYSEIIKKAMQDNTDRKIISALYWAKGTAGRYIENDYSSALNDFKTALEYNSANIAAIKAIELIKIEFKDYDGALLTATNAIKLEPRNSDFYMDRADIYGAMKDYDNAIKDYTQSIIFKSKNPRAFKLRGCSKILKGEVENGILDLKYAKQQYYDLGRYENYKEVVNLIETVRTHK